MSIFERKSMFEMRPKIFINGRFLTQQITGVQSFARAVCSELNDHSDFSLLVPTKADLVDAAFSDKIRRIGRFQGHLWEQVSLPLFLRQQKNAVLLNLCNTAPLMLHDQIVTIHDLAFIKDPSWFNVSFAKYYSWLIPRIVRRSRSVLTVSETVKKELIEAFGLSSDKIIVVGNKVSSDLLEAQPALPAAYNIHARKYFLLVGSDDPRKNFSFIEKLFEDKLSNYQLVIVGGRQSSFNTTERTSNHLNIIRLGYTDLSTLSWLYRNSLGLINPSFYEGFGIPNLEAFAFGCPVFCSDVDVFREICGEAASYFDPRNPDSASKLLLSYLEDPAMIKNQVNTGLEVFKKFQESNRAISILKAIER